MNHEKPSACWYYPPATHPIPAIDDATGQQIIKVIGARPPIAADEYCSKWEINPPVMVS